MRRRRILAGLLLSLAAPLAADAQHGGKVYRIGVLSRRHGASANIDAFRQGLRELGYVEGRNMMIEYRSADGRSERFPDLAAELVRLKVDVILTRGTPAVMAAKSATGTIPVVMAASGDPVLSGVVSSLARPGGNVTGLSAIVGAISGKRLELIREVVPGVSRVAALFNMSNLYRRSSVERNRDRCAIFRESNSSFSTYGSLAILQGHSMPQSKGELARWSCGLDAPHVGESSTYR